MKRKTPRKAPDKTQRPPRLSACYAEKQRRWRALHGGRTVTFSLAADQAAAVIYLKKQWGFPSNAEVVRVALLHLTRLTREGLTEIKIGFGEEEPEQETPKSVP